MIIGGQVLAIDVLEIKEGRVYFQIVRQDLDIISMDFDCDVGDWNFISLREPEISLGGRVFYLRGAHTGGNHKVVSVPWGEWGGLMRAIKKLNVKLYVACQLEEEFFERVAS